jgi:hypothetical protein
MFRHMVLRVPLREWVVERFALVFLPKISRGRGNRDRLVVAQHALDGLCSSFLNEYLPHHPRHPYLHDHARGPDFGLRRVDPVHVAPTRAGRRSGSNVVRPVRGDVHSEAAVALFEERRALIFDQLDKLTSRARLLQRSITALYSSLGIMVGTSVAIGLVAVVGRYLWIQWIPIALTLIGIGFLFYSSILLIFEARLALVGVHAEMDFLWRLGQQYRPPTADRHGQDRS